MELENRCRYLVPPSNFTESNPRRSGPVDNPMFHTYGKSFHLPEHSSAFGPSQTNDRSYKKRRAESPTLPLYYSHPSSSSSSSSSASKMYGQVSHKNLGDYVREDAMNITTTYSYDQNDVTRALPQYVQTLEGGSIWDTMTVSSYPDPAFTTDGCSPEWFQPYHVASRSGSDLSSTGHLEQHYDLFPPIKLRSHLQTPPHSYPCCGDTSHLSYESSQPSESSHLCPHCFSTSPISSSSSSSWDSSTLLEQVAASPSSPDITNYTTSIPLHQPRPERPIPIIPLSELASACEELCISPADVGAAAASVRPAPFPEISDLAYPLCSNVQINTSLWSINQNHANTS